MTAPFIIFSLPRSRSKWLSVFLTNGKWVCCHDAILDLRSMDDLVNLLSEPGTGLCETSMAFAAPAIRKVLPGVRFVVVRRDIEEVRASLLACGLGPYPEGMLEDMAEQVDAVSAMPGTLTVDFSDLVTEAGCRKIYEHCLGEEMDTDWWLNLAGENIQIDMDGRKAKCSQAVATVAGFASDVTDLMAPISIQEENWFDFAPDGLPLIWEHYREVGSYEHEEFCPNVPLIEKMAEAGVIQIVTARAGRKLVGYLVFTICPSMKSLNELNAVQAPFYVKPAWRGWTGLALHRESIAKLKEKGVKRLTLRSGVKGVAERQDVLFRRLGAVEDGHMFNLWIGD